MVTTVDINPHAHFKYDDVDLSEYSEEELIALGIPDDEIAKIKEESAGEDEDEEEVEDQDENEEEVEEEEPKKPEPKIPKSRFDEAVQKEREKAQKLEERTRYLEDQINKLLELQLKKVPEEKQVETTNFDFDKAEEQYAELLISGEIQDAAKLRSQINKERDKQFQTILANIRKEAEESVKNTTKALSEAEKKNLVIQEAFVEYPFLDSENENFNEELVSDINLLAASYETNKGMSPSVALKSAINKLVPKKQTKDSTKQQKKVESMSRQPPDTKSSKVVKDKNIDELDFENMSQREFRELYKKHPNLINEYLRKPHFG